MKKNKTNELKYGNPIIAAEIKHLEKKLKSHLKTIRTKNHDPRILQYKSQNEVELIELMGRLSDKRYAYHQGIDIARSKAFAKKRFHNNKLQRIGV
jgi:hypothetical protein